MMNTNLFFTSKLGNRFLRLVQIKFLKNICSDQLIDFIGQNLFKLTQGQFGTVKLIWFIIYLRLSMDLGNLIKNDL